LLLVSDDPLSAEEVMEWLNISRGNANMSLRALIDWELVEKLHKLGQRKEFFSAEKDMWKVATRIARGRRKRELMPVLSILEQVKEIETTDSNKKEAESFINKMDDIENFTKRVDRMFERLDHADERWFSSIISKVIKR